jgi:hypothetical protein
MAKSPSARYGDPRPLVSELAASAGG